MLRAHSEAVFMTNGVLVGQSRQWNASTYASPYYKASHLILLESISSHDYPCIYLIYQTLLLSHHDEEDSSGREEGNLMTIPSSIAMLFIFPDAKGLCVPGTASCL